MLNVQNCFVHRESWIDWLENDDLKNLFEIIDDKCDDEIIIHVLSQLKKKHVVDAFSCYDVLIFDNEHFKFVRHWTSIVQLIEINQIEKAFENIKCIRKQCLFVCCLSCKTIWRCFVSLRSSNLLHRWQKWISRTSCKKWTSICLVRNVENRSCSEFNTQFDEA